MPDRGGPGGQRWEAAGDQPIAGQTTYTRARGQTSDLDPGTEDLDALTKEDLQGRLKHLGLPVSGTKEELVERVRTGAADDAGDNS